MEGWGGWVRVGGPTSLFNALERDKWFSSSVTSAGIFPAWAVAWRRETPLKRAEIWSSGTVPSLMAEIAFRKSYLVQVWAMFFNVWPC